MKRARPSVREHKIFEIYVGPISIYVSLSRYDDGAPMEVFIDVDHVEGSATKAFCNAIARLLSRSLQHGIPMEELIDQLRDTKFLPSGIGRGHPAIEGKQCSSVLDAVARILDYEK